MRIAAVPRPDDELLAALAELLILCVEGCASLGFMRPLAPARAEAFWRAVAADAAAGTRLLLVAADEAGVCGTVQLDLRMPENQPHRAELVKMMVHPRCRRQGLATALMRAAEAAARGAGRSLLVLNTVSGSDASILYERLGWVRMGEIPRFALLPQGGLCDSTFFYRALQANDSGSLSGTGARSPLGSSSSGSG